MITRERIGTMAASGVKALKIRLKSARPYMAVFIISSVIVSRWFVPGTFISSGDTGPWIRQGWAPEATSSWNHTISGAGSAAYTVARGFEFVVLRFVGMFGGDDYVGQWLFYTLIYGLVGIGVAYAARAIVRTEAAAIAAGTFAVMNGFFLTRLPNPLNIISVGSIALVTGLALRVARGRKIGAPWAGIVLLPTSFLAFNPPMLIVAYAWALAGLPILIALMLGRQALGRLLKWMLAAVPWVLVLNAWWLVPLALSYLGGGGAVANVTFTDPTAWTWSQAQNQITNVLTLVANWAWTKPQYLPFASDLDQSWIVWARYLIPVLVFMAPVIAVRRLRRSALALVGLALLFVLLAKGVQPPFKQFNLFLYDHVPGFWLFREPMSKLGQLLVIFFGLLIAIVLESAWERWQSIRATSNRLLLVGVWTAFIIVVLQPYPLWTGAVIPDARPMQPSAHVRVPDFWRTMAEQINGDTRSGKVLVLPLDDYYQMPTTWGFAGVDSIANLLIQHPVVQPKPDGYFGDVPGFSADVHGVEAALLAGDLAAVPRLLTASGISQIVLRHDLVRGMPGRTFADDRVLSAALAKTHGMTLVRQGSLDLWYLGNGSLPTVHTFDAVLSAPAMPSAVAAAVGSLPGNIAVRARKSDPPTDGQAGAIDAPLVTDDVVDWQVPAVDSGDATTSLSLKAGTYNVAQRSRTAPALIPSIRNSSSGAQLVLSDPSEVRLDGRKVSSRPDLLLPVSTSKIVAVSANARTVFLDSWKRDMLPGAQRGKPVANYLPVGSSTKLTAWAPSAVPAKVDQPSSVYDCDNYEPRPRSQLGLKLTKTGSGQAQVLRLEAVDHAACTRISVADAKPGRTYRVRLEMRTVQGKRPEVCLWQLGTDGCSLVPRSPSSGDWVSFDQLVTIDQAAHGLQVVLYANVGVRNAFKTVTEYRGVSIEAVDPVLQTTVFPPEVPASAVIVHGGKHVLSIHGGQSHSVLGNFGPLENCYNTQQLTDEQAGLSKTQLAHEPQPAFRLTAQFDRACIAAPVPDMGASSLYELSYQGQSINLRNPTVCLYQRGPDRCTSIPAGGPWKGWTNYSTFVGPDPAAVETRLYLFGPRDLDGKHKAVVEYRAVKLRPVATPVDVVLTRRLPTAPPATVDYTKNSPTQFDVSVAGATAPRANAQHEFLGTGTFIALSEASAPGWQPQRAVGIDASGHMSLDGWMNAWPVTSSNANAVLAYAPDKYAQYSLRLLPIALVIAIFWLMVRKRVRRRMQGHLRAWRHRGGRIHG